MGVTGVKGSKEETAGGRVEGRKTAVWRTRQNISRTETFTKIHQKTSKLEKKIIAICV